MTFGPPFLAASLTAFATSTRPEPTRPGPNWNGEVGLGLTFEMAVFITSALISCTDQFGFCCLSSATTPAMCGAAIDVPLNDLPSVPVLPAAEKMFEPGALMSGFNMIREAS